MLRPFQFVSLYQNHTGSSIPPEITLRLMASLNIRIKPKYLGLIAGTLMLGLSGCSQSPQAQPSSHHIPTQTRSLAKFEPAGDQVLVFIGQDLGSIGGFEEYPDGYLDHFPTPAGFTLYTSIAGGRDSYGEVPIEGLQGIYETFDNGNGPSNMTLMTSDARFQNCALAIGLSLVNHEEAVAKGERDENIDRLGDYLLSLGSRPVFLRIGYEFDGHTWNHYDLEAYKGAYRRIKNRLDAKGITNTAYVWQSVGWVSNQEQLEEWYPGDEYVDWCAYSFFDRFKEAEMIDFAREKGKPIFIAEASAAISDHTAKFDGDTKETRLGNPDQAQEAWDKWFEPFFETIENNNDVIKAIHYINCDWSTRPMWFENPTFRDVDARIQNSEMISTKWMERMNQGRYVNDSPELPQVWEGHDN
ncbi:glycosyl hydrolase [Pontibacter sp. G13]|uniref:glycoside hydrolase family 26 protein n=1 Tax=Pontibacter sp. G13 TaxID=3074898 RepID=UPI00288A1DB2|nr:glycosyl hydrolase [Pontibacter sp. G13]WNJ16170.1 glycosyl hydrolase [Pontibacter sp. G13]